MADTPITVPTGSLGFTGNDAYFVNSGDNKLVFTGYAPVIVDTFFDREITPSTGSLNLTGYAPKRRQGLELVGQALTVARTDNHVVAPTTGSLGFSSVAPQIFANTPPAIKIVPPTGSLNFTGNAPLIAIQISALAPDALQITGYAPVRIVNTPVYPFFDQLAITGYAPTLKIDNFGTMITNLTASTDVPTNYQIDDRTGFKIKVKDPMVKEYTGHYVRPESLDKRSEQEFLKSKPEHHRGPLRPEPVGDETFIDSDDPVTVDDL